jgi:hypothetical protein
MHSETRSPAIAGLLLVVLSVVGGGSWILAQGQFPGTPQPAFGTLTASPPNIVFNTPTTVTFSISIDAPTLNPTSVELQRVDATGQVESTIARMLDDGRSADQKPGDRVFTASVTLNEPAVGRLHFRAAAAFRGSTQNAQSAVAFFDVDPIPLPPDPGDEGRRTLAGIDSDSDGVRDDVQRYLGLTYPDSTSTRVVLSRHAAAIQKYMSGAQSPPTLDDLKEVFRATNCVVYSIGADSASTAVPALESVAMNTSERFKAYLASWALVHELPPPPRESELASLCSL